MPKIKSFKEVVFISYVEIGTLKYSFWNSLSHFAATFWNFGLHCLNKNHNRRENCNISRGIGEWFVSYVDMNSQTFHNRVWVVFEISWYISVIDKFQSWTSSILNLFWTLYVKPYFPLGWYCYGQILTIFYLFLDLRCFLFWFCFFHVTL